MRKTMLLLSLFSLLGFSIQAQDFTQSKDSDPEARAILKQLKAKYDAYQSLEAEITMEIELPQQPKIVQKGMIARSGDKYRFKMGTQDAISDGQLLWLIMHNNKMVQINNVPEEGETSLLSPQTLFSFYERDGLVSYLTNEMMDNGKLVQQIEFKPTDDDADYSKILMTIDKKEKEILRVKAFGKDGSRFTFLMDSLTPNKTFPANYFTFSKAEYPGYDIEDLRN
jgi:outer membrane lipoprotein-sorting protein